LIASGRVPRHDSQFDFFFAIRIFAVHQAGPESSGFDLSYFGRKRKGDYPALNAEV
jgi:hypothetical protein